jgi:hypothetical protein
MKLEPDYLFGEEIRALAQNRKTPAQILRWMATQGLSPAEMMIQFAAAFGLPTSATACINGWWHDESGELTDADINQILTGEIAAQRKDKAA